MPKQTSSAVRTLQTSTGEVNLKIPKLRRQTCRIARLGCSPIPPTPSCRAGVAFTDDNGVGFTGKPGKGR
jgi:hypothetical protein